MPDYLTIKKTDHLPRLPLEGSIDLTYRCNNNCRHCWLIIPMRGREKDLELSFDEICHFVDEARALGCRQWSISGGEPMIRQDFPEIFDYITRKSRSYSINSNGTLITPEIAELMTRKGRKMIALYGASEAVHDHITRNPGSFKATMQGFKLLQEAGAGFTVQLIPLKDNYHEYPAMVELAKSLSRHWRVGAPWLFLSANGSPEKNAEIEAQRLPPADVIALDNPDMTYTYRDMPVKSSQENFAGDSLLAHCIHNRRDFHIDPYGKMTFCEFVKDPSMRYNLRTGSFSEAWEKFIPSLAGKVKGGTEYWENCGVCENQNVCRICPVYSYLETGRYSAKIPYLCTVAREEKIFRDEWPKKHHRYFKIGGITICIESDLDLDKVRFNEALAHFAVDGPGDDNVLFRYIFEIPDLNEKNLGTEVYRKAPWVISRKNGTWSYRGISPARDEPELCPMWVFSADYTRATIYLSPLDGKNIQTHVWNSLAHLPTDQIWLAPLLADRDAVLVHSAAAIVNGQGLLFVGHSGAGKSTTLNLLKTAGENFTLPGEGRNGRKPLQTVILCDDRNIVRRRNDGWDVYGTWSHGDVPEVSAASAPLRAILFLQQDTINRLTPITDRKEIWKRLLATLIRPMVTEAWWQKELDVLEKIVEQVPCFTMQFDKSGAIINELVHIVLDNPGTVES